MQVNGISDYQNSMAMEPQSVKTSILVGAGIGMAVSAVVGGLWTAGMINVNKLNSPYDTLCKNDLFKDSVTCSYNVYDVGAFYNPIKGGMWSD